MRARVALLLLGFLAAVIVRVVLSGDDRAWSASGGLVFGALLVGGVGGDVPVPDPVAGALPGQRTAIRRTTRSTWDAWHRPR